MAGQPIDFATGKLQDVARHLHPSLMREYALFWGVLVATSIPYGVAWWFYPLGTPCVVLCMAYLQVLFTLARSSGTSASHYMRFLLSGSNPIGMTGASSLLFGGVDAIVDWREDRSHRSQRPLGFYLQLLGKFALTPIGGVLLIAEYLWDLLMLRHPRLFVLKWNELFSLARYHDIICPEKSNDIFYADMAMARYCNDPFLYQWNRMRALVFELEQYRADAELGRGVPESNLFLQSDVAAYQTLKRLEVERIEGAIDRHYQQHLEEFPFPESLAKVLIRNARPVSHFLSMGKTLRERQSISDTGDLSQLLRELYPGVSAWKVLRILDTAEPATDALSRYLSPDELSKMADKGVLQRNSKGEYRLSVGFEEAFGDWLASRYVVAEAREEQDISLGLIPDFFVYQGKPFVRRS